jgi:Invasin, domain 3
MKTQNLALFVMLSLPFIFSGCASSNFVSPTGPMDKSLLKTEQANADILVPQLEAEYYQTNQTDPRKTQIREQMVDMLLRLDDEYYRKWVSDFYGQTAGFNTITEVAAPVFSGVSTLETGGASKALALISTGIGALNVSVSKNFLQQTAISILTARSEAQRATVRARIDENMTNIVADYPLREAMEDVSEYALVGSLPEAAQAIAGDTAVAKTAAQTNHFVGRRKNSGSGKKVETVSAANTTITASPTTIKADGKSSAKLTVQAYDATNTKMTNGGGVVVLSTSTGTVAPTTAHDNSDGTYTAILTSSAVGSANLTGTIDGNPIGVTMTVTITPP